MTGDSAREALTTRFLSVWTAAHPTIQPFIEGDREPDLTTMKVPFATFKVGLPRVFQAELAASHINRYEGVVEVLFFVPAGQGTKPFFDMNETVVGALAAQVVSGIRMHSAVPFERQPGVGWQSRGVLVNYSFDSSN